MTCEMQAELKGQRMWPWEEPVEKALGCDPGTKGRCEEFVGNPECCVARWARRGASRTPGAIAEAGAHGSREGAHLGWGGEGQSKAELKGKIRSVTQDGAKGGEWLQESSCSGHGSWKPSRKLHFPGAGAEGGREKAEWDPAKDAWRSVCVKPEDWGGRHGWRIPWGEALQSQEGAGVWRSREDKH